MDHPHSEIELLLMELVENITNISRKPIILDGYAFYRREIHIIERIGASEGVTSTELAQFFGVTRAVIHKTVLQLVEKELIFKAKGETNNKNKELYLTEKGKHIFSLHEEYHQQLSRDFHRFLESKDASVKKHFIDFLQHTIRLTKQHI